MTTSLSQAIAELLTPRCGCSDCESGVSPGAYLATLTDYALKVVRDRAEAMSLGYLERRFHQPFSELPLDCAGAETPIAQSRVAVEVLRGYLGSRPLLGPNREAAAAAGEAAYRFMAYSSLLVGLGTTFDEMRRAKTAHETERTAVAQRLAITLTPPGGAVRNDELDQMLRDPEAAPTDPAPLTEEFLERTFGLRSTNGQTLNDGLKYGDAAEQFTSWRFTGIDPGRNTDADGTVHLALSQNAGSYVVSVFANPGRTKLVAAGGRSDPNGRVRLSAANGSGLSGEVTLAYSADANDTAIAVAPLVLCRRLNALRNQWFDEDWRSTPPVDTKPLRPIIDPHAIGLPDLRNTRPGDPAYDLWIARVNALDTLRTTLKQARAVAADPLAALDDQLDQALSMPGDAVTTGRLDELREAELEGQRIESRLSPIGLDLPAFRFLIPIVTTIRGGQDILDPEWQLLEDTLVSAHRTRQFTAWRAAEEAAAVTLSPSFFRIAAVDAAPELASNPDTPLWLSTGAARRTWSGVLSARFGQERNLVTGTDGTCRMAEETALPYLRDVLIGCSDAEGQDLPSRAEWLTRRLLVDMRKAGTHQTTRVAQALETLQELIFRLRTGQFGTDNPQPSALTSVRAVADRDGRTHLLATDDNRELWHRVWDGTWRSWRSRGALPGNSTSIAPSEVGVTAHGNGFDIGVVAADQTLWVRRFREDWQPWANVPNSGPLSLAPALVGYDADALDVFVHRATDAAVLRHHFDGTAWLSAEDTGATSQRSPAATQRAAWTVDLVLAKAAPNLFQPLHRRRTGAAWVDEDLDGQLDSDVAMITTDGVDLQIYQNTGSRLQRKVNNGGWQPWEMLDPPVVAPLDPKLQGTPAAITLPGGIIDVFAVRDERGNRRLWHRRYAAGAWEAWEVITYEDVSLFTVGLHDFDAEWAWLGSYATYRSAAMVRFYPDFLLLPSLAPHQTPAFERLASESRPSQQITPTQARDLAQQYSDYLDDVAQLNVEASCRAITPLGAATASSGLRSLMFMFGRAFSGTAYWCSFDPSDDETGYAQSFWTKVPLTGSEEKGAATGSEEKSAAFKVDRILGAVPWINSGADRHHIYLFLVTKDWSGRKLQQARYDVNTGAWEPAQEIGGPLPTAYGFQPGTLENNDVVVVQSDTAHEAPRLAVRPFGPSPVYIRPVNHDVDGFQASPGDWADFLQPASGYIAMTTLYAALRCNGLNWIVHQSKTGVGASAYIPDNNPFTSDTVGLMFWGSSKFVGAIPSDNRNIYVFVEQDGAHKYQRTSLGAPTTLHNFSPAVTRIMPHSGSSPAFFTTLNTDGRAYAYTCDQQVDKLVGHSRFTVLPKFSAPSASRIRSGGRVFDLQTRRAIVADTYTENTAVSESILQYLREAYRLVPQQLGLALQAPGHFVEALDWFATVYDYRAPMAKRYIDYGLTLDVQLWATSVIRWPEGWLLDPLNPHAIARTRRGATARYAISAIVACCNAHADAEFSTDNPESLVRARVLYDTALQLCELPELRQDIPDCDALLTMLEVRPGEAVPPEIAAALGAAKDDFTRGAPLKLQTMHELTIKLAAAKAGTLDWDDFMIDLADARDANELTALPPTTLQQHLSHSASLRAAAHGLLLTDPAMEVVARRAGVVATTIAGGGGQQ